ncbi:MAG: hypothetical protein V3574_01530 [Candidatus Moraniibacteriota bacterium]
MKRIVMVSFLLLPFFAQAYYYGSQGYSTVPYPGSIAGGVDALMEERIRNQTYDVGSRDSIGDSDSYKKQQLEHYEGKVNTFCSPSGYIAERCNKYCGDLKEWGGKSNLCNREGVSQSNAADQRKIAEIKKQQEEFEKQKQEEEARQELERREGEITENVNNIFRLEFEEKNENRIVRINEAKNESKIKVFLIGSDDKIIDDLRSDKTNIEIQIIKLNKILSETMKEENKILIQEKINLFNEQKLLIEGVISENENKAGIFGWVKNIFRYKY